MGILQGSKADLLQPQVALNTVLDNTVDVSGPGPVVLPDFSLTLTLPGTYQLTCNLMTIIEVSAGQGLIIAGFFKDTLTPENTLLDSVIGIGVATELNVPTFQNGTLTALVTITGLTVIRVLTEAKSFPSTSATFTTAEVFADTVNVGHGQLQAIQLLN